MKEPTQEIKIKRDGNRDLLFSGTMLGHADGRTVSGPGQNRWSEVWLYRTDSGKYVWEHKYNSQWEGESGSHTANVYDSAEELIAGIEYREAAEHGYPRFGRLDKECLEEAAKEDKAIEEALVERI